VLAFPLDIWAITLTHIGSTRIQISMTLRSSRLPLIALVILAFAGRALALDTAPALQRYFTALDRAYAAWQSAPLRPNTEDVAKVRAPLDEAASAKAELVLLEGSIPGDDLIDLEKQLAATAPSFNGLRDWLASPASTPNIPAPKPAPVRKLFHFHNTERQVDSTPIYRQGASAYKESIPGSNLALKHITPHLSLLGGGDRAYLVTPKNKSYRIDRTTLWALGLQPRRVVGAQPLEIAKPESDVLAAGAERLVRDLRSNDAATAATTIRLLSSLELSLFTVDLRSGAPIHDLIVQEKTDRLQAYREHLAANPGLKGKSYDKFEQQLLRARAVSLIKDAGAPAAFVAGLLNGADVDLVVTRKGQTERVHVRSSSDVTLEHGMVAVEGSLIALDQIGAIEPSTYTGGGPKFTLSLSSLWHRKKKP